MRRHTFHPSPGRQGDGLRFAVIVVLLAIGLYGAWQQQRQHDQEHSRPRTVEPHVPPEATPIDDPQVSIPGAERPLTSSTFRTKFPQQTIRNEDGRVAYRGTVEVGLTLDRIERGERLEFPNDGTTFQNRERRLPRKPAGYYKEFVHPTPTLSGPGPQRIVVGRGGEAYYTPDHYRTFQRLDQH